MEITLPSLAGAQLRELISLCKASVTIDINDHRSCYESVKDYVGDDATEIDLVILQQMIDKDTAVRIQFYPLTPIGFHVVYHYDIDLAIQQALQILKDNHDQAGDNIQAHA